METGSCARVGPLVGALVDGELAEDLSPEVRRHVEACPACRALECDLRALSGLWAELPAVDVPRAALDRKIRPLARRPRAAAPLVSRVLGPLVGAAAAGIGFFVLSAAFPPGTPAGTPGPAGPASEHAELEAFVAETTAFALDAGALQHDWPDVHPAIEEHVIRAGREGDGR